MMRELGLIGVEATDVWMNLQELCAMCAAFQA